MRDGGLETWGQDCSRGFHVSSQYDAESKNVAMITAIASDVCGVQGGSQCGFEMKYLSPETLILNMDMHENLYLLTAPSIFLLLGASDNEIYRRCSPLVQSAVACKQGWVQAHRRGLLPPFMFHRTGMKLFI